MADFSFTRKQLLCRSEQELRRLCRRSNINVADLGAVTKRDLVEVLLLTHRHNNSSSSSLKTSTRRKPRPALQRSHSIAATLTDDSVSHSRHSRTKPVSKHKHKHHNTNHKSRPDTLYTPNNDDSSLWSPKWQSQSRRQKSQKQSKHQQQQAGAAKQRPKHAHNKQKHLRTQSATLPSSILSSINDQLSKKTKRRKRSSNNDDANAAEMEYAHAHAHPPTLKMESLIQLHTAGLHETVEYESDDSVDVFVEHMALSELRAFRVDDCLDFRADSGFVFGATIMNKAAHVLTISFKERSGKLRTIDCNYHKALYRFARYQSISQRGAHRMRDVQVGSMVDVRPRHVVQALQSNEWMVGEVVMKDVGSGQCQIEYSHRAQKWCYWVHVDNTAEVAPYLSHYDFRQFALNMDRYLDTSTSTGTAGNEAAAAAADVAPKLTKAATVDVMPQQQQQQQKYNDDLDDFFYDDDEDEKSDEQNSSLMSATMRRSTYHLWNYNDVINWLNSIEGNRFNGKYDRLKRAIIAYDINHSRLSQLNELTLKVLGVTDENDRQLMLSHIAEITHTASSLAESTHMTQNKEEEIAQLKQQISQLKSLNALPPKRKKSTTSLSLDFDATSMPLPPLKAAKRRGSRHHRRRKSSRGDSKYMSELRRLSSLERIVASENAMITSDTEWPYDS